MPLMRMEHDVDPKQEALTRVGALDGFRVLGNQVLVAIYERPAKTASGILLPGSVLREDEFQGKVGLVLAMGPDAFVDDGKFRFPVKPELNDWIVFKVSDGWPFALNSDKGHCRMIVDVDVRAIVDQPDRVF